MSEYCTIDDVAFTLDANASIMILMKNPTIAKKDSGMHIFK